MQPGHFTINKKREKHRKMKQLKYICENFILSNFEMKMENQTYKGGGKWLQSIHSIPKNKKK